MLKSLTAFALITLASACNPIKVTTGHGDYPVHNRLQAIGTPGWPIQLGNDITLTCTMSSPPSSVADCVGGGFPFTVPVGKTFCLTHMYLQNKFFYDPLAYGGSMRAMYLQEQGVTVSSHHPNLHFNPPYPIFAGQKLTATISNAQSEAQNVYAFEQGFLVDAGKDCKR
jgi:hypothetical protein